MYYRELFNTACNMSSFPRAEPHVHGRQAIAPSLRNPLFVHTSFDHGGLTPCSVNMIPAGIDAARSTVPVLHQGYIVWGAKQPSESPWITSTTTPCERCQPGPPAKSRMHRCTPSGPPSRGRSSRPARWQL